MDRKIASKREIVSPDDVKRVIPPGTTRGMTPPGGPEVPAATAVPDKYTDRLIKLIPAEIVAIYPALQTIALGVSNVDSRRTLLWAVFALLLFVLTPFYLAKVQGITKRGQLMLSSLSFGVWAFSLGEPFVSVFKDADLYRALSSIVLILFTFVAPYYYKGKE